MLSQHEAVVKFTKEILGERFVAGDVKEIATKTDQRNVATRIAEEMFAGKVVLGDGARAKFGESVETLVKGYVMGMVKNWWNKSLELNGGVPWETKGSRDGVLKELRALKTKLGIEGNTEGLARVEKAIQDRLEELKPKAKEKEINGDLIPDYLQDLIAQ